MATDVRPESVTPAPTSAEAALATRAQAVEDALTAVRGMPIDHRTRALALKEAVEAFHAEGLRTIVRTLKADPQGRELLFALVDHPEVYALLAMHGIVRPDVRARVVKVVEDLRPYTKSHGGDVELVDVRDGVVYLRLHGSCNGCSMSSVTLRTGVEDALREQVPEITAIEVVPNEPAAETPALVSLRKAPRDNGWVTGPTLASVPDAVPVRLDLQDGRSVVIIRVDDEVNAFNNACAHLGLAIDGGTVDREARTITCPWHGFRFDCTNGECLTAPQAQLEQVPTRIEDGVILVRPTA